MPKARLVHGRVVHVVDVDSFSCDLFVLERLQCRETTALREWRVSHVSATRVTSPSLVGFDATREGTILGVISYRTSFMHRRYMKLPWMTIFIAFVLIFSYLLCSEYDVSCELAPCHAAADAFEKVDFTSLCFGFAAANLEPRHQEGTQVHHRLDRIGPSPTRKRISVWTKLTESSNNHFD